MLLIGPKSLTVVSIDGAIRDAAPGSLAVDLSAVTFIEPSGLVVLAVLLDMAATRGWSVAFKPPENHDARVYMSRMGIRDRLVAVGCGEHLPVVRRHPPGNRFVELQRFDASNPAEDLIDLIDERLRTWGDGYLAALLYDTMLELGLNVEEHAEEPGFVAAQCYPRMRRVCAAVGDFGIGIQASLEMGGHTFGSPADAILQASTTRISAKGSNGGAGLPHVVQAFTQKQGVVTVVSGGTAVTFRSGADPQMTGLQYPTPGTFLFATLRWR